MAGAQAAGSAVRRWRWRLRGAAMWPAFGVCLVADFALLLSLPPWGDAMGGVDAFLVAGFCNLVVVAVAAPLAGLLVRRWRGDLPRVVARDYAGTALLAAATIGLLIAGLVHQPAMADAQRSFQAQSDAMRLYVADEAPAQYRRHINRADSVRLDAHLFRTCVPGDDPQRALCLFIDTSQSPPGVRLDPDQAPNWRYFNHRPAAFESG